MLCDQCKTRQATIHLENNINGKVQTLNLCQHCAAEMGLNTGGSFMSQLLGGGFFGLNSGSSVWQNQAPYEACPTCGTSFQDFQNTGLFGCPDCYQAFEPKLSSIFKRVQADQNHVGRRLATAEKIKTLTDVTETSVYKPVSESVSEPVFKNVSASATPNQGENQGEVDELTKLKAAQDQAVVEEDYEKAAKIRDQIKALQKKED